MVTTGRRAFITGITGQDGSYLAQLLLAKGYEVHGLIRRSSSFNTQRLEAIYQDPHEAGARLFLHYGDLADANSMSAIIRTIKPTEVYNIGAQSHVRVSFDMPIYTTEVDAVGAIKLLEAVRDYQEQSGYQIRDYQASSSEMFGKVQEVPQRETTPFSPPSPYGCAKVFAHCAPSTSRWDPVRYWWRGPVPGWRSSARPRVRVFTRSVCHGRTTPVITCVRGSTWIETLSSTPTTSRSSRWASAIRDAPRQAATPRRGPNARRSGMAASEPCCRTSNSPCS